MRRIQSEYQVVGVIGAIILCTISDRGFAAPAVIGNWEGGATDGWIDWGNGQTPIGPSRIEFNSVGATVGTGAIQFNLPSNYTQWAAIKLQNDGIAANGEVSINAGGVPDYVEIVFESYSNGSVKYHLDNVRLYTPVPEPASLALRGLAAAMPCWSAAGVYVNPSMAM